MNFKVNKHSYKTTVQVLGICFLSQADKWASFTGDTYNLENFFVVIFIYTGAERVHVWVCLHACGYMHAHTDIFKRENLTLKASQCTATRD